jgi:RNA polymerase sigma factor (sigma-70 family)
MAGDRIGNLIRFLRRTAVPPDGPGVSDAHLLERYTTTGDEAAFELLAWRHGPMVLGVCHRVLGDTHDAEDAFQAAFLVLARKSASAARHRSAAGWLYTVAYRVALRARARRALRLARERSFREPLLPASSDPADEAAWRDARHVIDEEVGRLPEKYRIPFILCHLEGRSNAEVAQELGCPVGTVESWLTRARARLRIGLSRRGLTLASGMLAGLAPQAGWLPQAAAAARASLAASRGMVEAVSAEATALAGEVVRALGMARAKVFVLMLLATATVGIAAVGLAVGLSPRAETREKARPGEARPAVRAIEPVKQDTLRGGHLSAINAVVLTGDGKTLASAGDDARVVLWDVPTGKPRTTLRQVADLPVPPDQLVAHDWPVNALTISLDSKLLASGGVDRVIRLWDVERGKQKAVLRGCTVFIYSLAFSPDGKTLAAAGGVQPAALDRTIRWNFREIPTGADQYKELGEVSVWDLATGKQRTLLHGDTGRIMSLSFSPDGKTLAAGGRDGTIRLWETSTGKMRARFRENAREVASVAFSPDGKTLAAAQCDQKDRVKLWDVVTGRVRARLNGHDGAVVAVAFSPDGTLATASNIPPRDPREWQNSPGEVRLWNGVTGKALGAPLGFDHRSSSVAFGAHGKLLATAGACGTGPGEITLWRLGSSNGQ